MSIKTITKQEQIIMEKFADILDNFLLSVTYFVDSNDGETNYSKKRSNEIRYGLAKISEKLDMDAEEFAKIFIKMFPGGVDNRDNGLDLSVLRKLKYGAGMLAPLLRCESVSIHIDAMHTIDDLTVKHWNNLCLLAVDKMRRLAGGAVVAVRHYIKNLNEGGLHVERKVKQTVVVESIVSKKSDRKTNARRTSGKNNSRPSKKQKSR